ncbi:MAG: phosphoribosylformylglycinamidine synthase subunit PurQ [Acidobacteriota bacterium]
MKVAVIVFPGSNCDHDVHHVLKRGLGVDAALVWYRDTDLRGYDAVVLPGGFSYGDYLRSGAIASLAPVMREVSALAGRGAPVLGICNGFQILCEAGLLPGALQRNRDLRFVCQDVTVRVEQTDTPFTGCYTAGDTIRMPVAHFDGRYFADPEVLDGLEDEARVIFRYATNPNGAARDIAGIASERRNVVGLMPHPERACNSLLGSADGRRVFESLAESCIGA